MAAFLQSLLYIVMVLLSLFLILIILLQRGKGGGLAGAFGGMGGQSAFGVKSSDVFLRITIVAAIIWFVICIGGRFVLEMKHGKGLVDGSRPVVVANEGESSGDQTTTAENAAPADAAPTDAAPADTIPANTAPTDAAPANGE